MSRDIVSSVKIRAALTDVASALNAFLNLDESGKSADNKYILNTKDKKLLSELDDKDAYWAVHRYFKKIELRLTAKDDDLTQIDYCLKRGNMDVIFTVCQAVSLLVIVTNLIVIVSSGIKNVDIVFIALYMLTFVLATLRKRESSFDSIFRNFFVARFGRFMKDFK